MNLRLTTLFIVLFILAHSCKKDSNSPSKSANGPTLVNYQNFQIDTTDFSNKTLTYYLDTDSIISIRLTKTIINDSIKQTTRYSGSIYGVTDSMRFCYLKNDPSTNFVEVGDKIESSEKYQWIKSVTYTSSFPLSTNYNVITSVFTDYFGFQLFKNDNTYNGWFRLNHLEIKEIAIQKASKKQILVGQKY